VRAPEAAAGSGPAAPQAPGASASASADTDTALHTWRRHAHAADPPADALAAAFAALPAGRGRQMLDTALARGIDAVADPPPALVDFFAQVDVPPLWVDWPRIERGGALFLRSGLAGTAVLNLACLPRMYRSPTGNKPLVHTGQLLRRAPRRLAETARFMLQTSQPGGLRRDGPGFATTLRVRLMHAQVRRLMLQSGRWNSAWGAPVNQLYMAATGVTLSVVFLDGLRRLGLHASRREADALMALWRYSSHLMGVVPELQCSTEEEGWHLLQFMDRQEGPPDDDSRALIHAVMTAPYLPELEAHRWRIPAAWDLSRAMVGNDVADSLGYPPAAGWAALRPVAWPVLAALNGLQRLWPAAHARAVRTGAARTEAIVARIMAGGRPAMVTTPAAGRPTPQPQEGRP